MSGIEVLEDGIGTLRSTTNLRWLAADLYSDRDPEKYRRTLKELSVDHTKWKAYDELKESENLSMVRQYRELVATVDPVEYFEFYRELLVPFTAGETGRRHYRKIADHLEEMQCLVPEERFEEFLDFLKDKHSNRQRFSMTWRRPDSDRARENVYQ